MKLTQEDYMGIVWGDNDDFQLMKDEIVDRTRWAIVNEVICRHKPTDKFYRFYYDSPATEMQEVDRPDDLELEEVRPVEKTVIVYEKVA